MTSLQLVDNMKLETITQPLYGTFIVQSVNHVLGGVMGTTFGLMAVFFISVAVTSLIYEFILNKTEE